MSSIETTSKHVAFWCGLAVVAGMAFQIGAMYTPNSAVMTTFGRTATFVGGIGFGIGFFAPLVASA